MKQKQTKTCVQSKGHLPWLANKRIFAIRGMNKPRWSEEAFRRWLMTAGGLFGLVGILGATLFAHVRPVPALGQAAYIALFHAPVLLWLSREKPSSPLQWVAVGYIGGLAIFVGTIYLRYLLGIEGATRLAPLGGSLLILAWGGLFLLPLMGKKS